MATLHRFPNDYDLIVNIFIALVPAASLSWTTFVYVGAERKKKSDNALQTYIKVIDKVCSQLSNPDIQAYQKFEHLQATYHALRKIVPLITDGEHKLHSEIKNEELKLSLTEFYFSLKVSDIFFVENDSLEKYHLGNVAQHFGGSAYWLTVLWLKYVIPSIPPTRLNGQYLYGFRHSLQTDYITKVISLFISGADKIINHGDINTSITNLANNKLIDYDPLILRILEKCPTLLAHLVLKNTLIAVVSSPSKPKIYRPLLSVYGPKNTWLAMQLGQTMWNISIPEKLQQPRIIRPKEKGDDFSQKYVASFNY